MKAVPSMWQRLSKNMEAQKCFKASRITPRALYRAYRQKRAAFIVREVNGQKEIVAFGALWPTKSVNWWEVGSLYTADTHTKQGLCSNIFHTLLKLPLISNKSLFLITKTSAIGRVAMAADWSHDTKKIHCKKAIYRKRPLDDGREIYYRLPTTS